MIFVAESLAITPDDFRQICTSMNAPYLRILSKGTGGLGRRGRPKRKECVVRVAGSGEFGASRQLLANKPQLHHRRSTPVSHWAVLHCLLAGPVGTGLQGTGGSRESQAAPDAPGRSGLHEGRDRLLSPISTDLDC